MIIFLMRDSSSDSYSESWSVLMSKQNLAFSMGVPVTPWLAGQDSSPYTTNTMKIIELERL